MAHIHRGLYPAAGVWFGVVAIWEGEIQRGIGFSRALTSESLSGFCLPLVDPEEMKKSVTVFEVV